METLDGAGPLSEQWRRGIVALGNFDGVHLGHQAVIGRAFDRARQTGRPAMVVTFEPHPVRYFRPDAPPFRLTTLSQRGRLLADLDVDAMVVLPFDAALAGLDAPAFFEQILVERLGICGLVTGEGFHFGYRRSGDEALLRRLGKPIGIEVDAEVSVILGDAMVSSTRIREALRLGDTVAAADLLSRPFVIDGPGRADAGGTSVLFDDYVRPPTGAYQVRLRTDDGKSWRGIGRSIEAAVDRGGNRLWLPTSFALPHLQIELLRRLSD